MDRKEFLIKAALTTIFAKTILTSEGWASTEINPLDLKSPTDLSTIPELQKELKTQFKDLLMDLEKKGWGQVVKEACGVDLKTILSSGDDSIKHPDLFKELIINRQLPGFEDFVGNKLISPGEPAFSLLYHVFASPLVKLKNNQNPDLYPSLDQIDQLENIIYGLKEFMLEPDVTYYLAVFAYEYRPACKTPHACHDDMVYARGGFARVGSEPMNYDAINRCYTNLPKNGPEKNIAVTPARYALFLAKAYSIKSDNLKVDYQMNTDSGVEILLPVRKVFDKDPILDKKKLFFSESHRNEKLYRLCTEKPEYLPKGVFREKESPFIRESSSSTNKKLKFDTYDKTMVELSIAGSSVLLNSFPQTLVREAKQEVNGVSQRLRINIPSAEKKGILEYTNRRYTSLKILNQKQNNIDAWDAVQEKFLESLAYPGRTITNYHVPRNAPMFVNIREKVNEKESGALVEYLGPTYPKLQTKVNEPYCAGLFEDSICDGCIDADLTGAVGNMITLSKFKKPLKILPAFSVVTAPDFFPLTDSDDLIDYEKMFLVGGVEDMGGLV